MRIAVDSRSVERSANLALPNGFCLCLVKSGLLALETRPRHITRFCRQSQILLFEKASQRSGAAAPLEPIAKTQSTILALVFDRDPFPAVEARFEASRDVAGFEAPWDRSPSIIDSSEGLELQVDSLVSMITAALRAGDALGSGNEERVGDFVLMASIAQLCALISASPEVTESEGEIGRGPPWSIEELIAWIDEHYDESFSLDEVVRRCAMNTSDFSRRFKELAGSPLFEYLNRRRISRAALLLKNGELPVIEVAYSVGYNNLSFFNRYFLRLMGQSPTEYRRQNR